MKISLYRVVILGLLAIAVGAADGGRVEAMQALSNADLGGVTGRTGVSIYFKDIDATLLQLDSILIDLSPSDTTDCKFFIGDDNLAKTLTVDHDADNIGFGFCGSGGAYSKGDEDVPIKVNYLGLDVDVGRGICPGETGLNANAVTLSLRGYGSTDLYNIWDLCQFIRGSTSYDVFGLRLGEIFWVEKYVDYRRTDSEKHLFMHILLSPLQSYTDSAFIDSNMGAWQGGGLAAAAIRSNTGVGGELGLKPGGGSFGFSGFLKTTGSPQRATANNVMLAGKIVDKGDSTTPYPNWMTQNLTYYYRDNVSDWNAVGEAVIGVHHFRTYTRTGYTGQYSNGNTFDFSTFTQKTIGKTSPTRPIRFEVATAAATYDADADGLRDTYLISYLCGHYSRTVYYPDSARSSMGTSAAGTPVPTVPAMKNYIIGDLRIGYLEEKTAYMMSVTGSTGSGVPDSTTSGGSWVVNDVSMEYSKAVIAGDRNLVQEISTASEPYIIPNRDYGYHGAAASSTQMTFLGDPTATSRTMEVAVPCNGGAGTNYALPVSEGTTPPDLSRPSAWWR